MGSTRSVVANVFDSDIIESVFELQSLHVYFWFHSLGKNMNSLITILQSYGLSGATVTYWPLTQPSIKEQVHPVEDIKI